jgi:hypothetical protein
MIARYFLPLWIAATFGGGCGRSHEKPDPVESSGEESAKFDHAEGRLVSMLDGGWVVSRSPDGSVAHQGDSLLFTGIGLGDLDCARGAALETALQAMIVGTDGKLYRHPSLPDAVSMDGAIGLYYGIAARIARCDGARSSWSALLAEHPAFWSDPLNAAAGVDLPLGFKYVRSLLGFRLGLQTEPDQDDLRELEKDAVAWTAVVKVAKAAADLRRRVGLPAEDPAAYRVHLAQRALATVEELGGAVSQQGRNDLCGASSGMGLIGVDYWCGRGGADEFIAGFQENEWEFRLQRAKWEEPDGQGLQTPGLDLIDAMHFRYGY